MTMFVPRRILTAASCIAAVVLSAAAAFAQSAAKIPPNVIDEVASRGVAPVLVGLKVPWQQEELLTEDGIRSQRGAIRLIQETLLGQLDGKRHSMIRRYDE